MKGKTQHRQWTDEELERYWHRCQDGWMTVENGDKATGVAHYEDGRMWFVVDGPNGIEEYETDERPCERHDLGLVRFPEGASEERVHEYVAGKRQLTVAQVKAMFQAIDEATAYK
jgi:hypothetical protein